MNALEQTCLKAAADQLAERLGTTVAKIDGYTVALANGKNVDVRFFGEIDVVGIDPTVDTLALSLTYDGTYNPCHEDRPTDFGTAFYIPAGTREPDDIGLAELDFYSAISAAEYAFGILTIGEWANLDPRSLGEVAKHMPGDLFTVPGVYPLYLYSTESKGGAGSTFTKPDAADYDGAWEVHLFSDEETRRTCTYPLFVAFLASIGWGPLAAVFSTPASAT